MLKSKLIDGYFEGDGTLLDNSWNVIGNVGGVSAIASKFTGDQGEQLLSYSKDGIIRIWVDRNAKDNEIAKRRYANPADKLNQKQTGNGYNLFNLGGIAWIVFIRKEKFYCQSHSKIETF